MRRVVFLVLLAAAAVIAACDRVVDLTPAPDALGTDAGVSGGDGGNDGGVGNDGGGGGHDGGLDAGVTDGGAAPDA